MNDNKKECNSTVCNRQKIVKDKNSSVHKLMTKNTQRFRPFISQKVLGTKSQRNRSRLYTLPRSTKVFQIVPFRTSQKNRQHELYSQHAAFVNRKVAKINSF